MSNNRVIIFSADQLKESFWNHRVDMDQLEHDLSTGPTWQGEWGAPFSLPIETYDLAHQGDSSAIRRIIDFCEVKPTQVCCEFRDLVLTKEGILAEVVPTGPFRDTFETWLAKDTYVFNPRYFFNKNKKLCIVTFDVTAR